MEKRCFLVLIFAEAQNHTQTLRCLRQCAFSELGAAKTLRCTVSASSTLIAGLDLFAPHAQGIYSTMRFPGPSYTQSQP